MDYNVIIVGAGPAGIGCALSLQRAGVEDVLLLEADRIGGSFRRWPDQMRPSFAFKMIGRQAIFAALFSICIAWSGALLLMLTQ